MLLRRVRQNRLFQFHAKAIVSAASRPQRELIVIACDLKYAGLLFRVRYCRCKQPHFASAVFPVLGIVDISGGHRCEAFDDTAPKRILGDSNRHVTTKITRELSDCARKANSQSSQTWTPVVFAGIKYAMRPADITQHERASVAHAHRNLWLFSERLSAWLRCLLRPMRSIW